MSASFPQPIYQTGGNHYEIDTCEPQRQAMREGKIQLHALSKGHYPGKRMNSNILPGLIHAGCWNCSGPQDWGLNAHRNEGLELVFVETGAMGFEVDGERHALQAGQLTITRPWQLHKLGDPHIGPGRLQWLILDIGARRPNQPWQWPSWLVLAARDQAELARKLRHSHQVVWGTPPRLRFLFKELADCVQMKQGSRATARLSLCVNGLLLELLDLLTEPPVEESLELQSRRRTVEFFLKDLAQNPLSCAEPWTLESMAQQCGLGITAMAKYCRGLVNSGPVAYLNACRLEHAAVDLLARPDASVLDVAMRAGFNSSQYFATQFRRRYRLSPSDYRQRKAEEASLARG